MASFREKSRVFLFKLWKKYWMEWYNCSSNLVKLLWKLLSATMLDKVTEIIMQKKKSPFRPRWRFTSRSFSNNHNLENWLSCCPNPPKISELPIGPMNKTHLSNDMQLIGTSNSSTLHYTCIHLKSYVSKQNKTYINSNFGTPW